jgi:hypothetical protein
METQNVRMSEQQKAEHPGEVRGERREGEVVKTTPFSYLLSTFHFQVWNYELGTMNYVRWFYGIRSADFGMKN